jgi:hypothetical protein
MGRHRVRARILPHQFRPNLFAQFARFHEKQSTNV